MKIHEMGKAFHIKNKRDEWEKRKKRERSKYKTIMMNFEIKSQNYIMKKEEVVCV